MFQGAMLKAVGMRKTTAWVPTEEPEQKSKNRKDRYRQKLAVSGIRQLNIQVPDSEQARGTFSKLASAVCKDEIKMEELTSLLDSPDNAEMALKIITVIHSSTIRGRLFKAILKFVIRFKIPQSNIAKSKMKEAVA